jgi:aarF domain-containing kinase
MCDLPIEMNFIHEAANSEKTRDDFKNIRTTLYIPEVLSATKRVLVMEYIEGRPCLVRYNLLTLFARIAGGRVDSIEYLAEKNINRNQVALEIAAIFNQMVLLNGWFHAVSRSIPIRISLIGHHCRIPTQV